MANVTGSDRTALSFNQTNSAGLITPLTFAAALNFTPSYQNGTGANQADLLYAAQLTIASSAHPFDLTSLLDMAGGSVNMKRVRELVVQVVDTTLTHVVNVYASSANGWTFLPLVADQLTVAAGGVLHMADPLSTGSATGLVTASNNKIGVIDAGSNSVVVNLMILGCSATS